MDDQLTERHYPKIDALVRRTTSDITPEADANRFSASSFLDDVRDPIPDNPRLISSAQGGVEELLFTIPAYAVQQPSGGQPNPLAQVYRDLFTKLPVSSKLIVMTHEAVQQTVSGWLRKTNLADNATIVAVPGHLHFSIWAEDGYVIVNDRDSDNRYMLEPFSFPRFGDGLIADFVSNETHLRSNQAPLYFQGGNVLIGDDFFFIGADYPAKSLDYINRVIVPNPNEKPVAAVRRLYREYMDTDRRLFYIGSTIPVPAQTERQIVIGGEQWKEILYLGNKQGTVQPLFHIDMFITLAGRDDDGNYQVLVGDPKMAADTLGVALWTHSMKQVYDNIARGLERIGFKVVRNPIPLVYVDDPRYHERIWYFATANNALVQITDTNKTVWLPTYGHGNWSSLTATDQQNKSIWESLGFTINLLGDFHPFAENLGAVHCIKKYLNRT